MKDPSPAASVPVDPPPNETRILYSFLHWKLLKKKLQLYNKSFVPLYHPPPPVHPKIAIAIFKAKNIQIITIARSLAQTQGVRGDGAHDSHSYLGHKEHVREQEGPEAVPPHRLVRHRPLCRPELPAAEPHQQRLQEHEESHPQVAKEHDSPPPSDSVGDSRKAWLEPFLPPQERPTDFQRTIAFLCIDIILIVTRDKNWLTSPRKPNEKTGRGFDQRISLSAKSCLSTKI